MSLLVTTPHADTLNIWWYGAACLHRAHRVWKWIVFKETYTDSKHWLGLSLGRLVLDPYINNTFGCRFPYVAFLVGKRFLDFMQQKDATEKAFCDWKQALQGIHPVNLYEKNCPLVIDRASTMQQLPIAWYHLSRKILIRVEDVALTTLNLASETFKLLMRIMDIFEFVSFDQQQYEELLRISVQEAPLNILHCMEALNRNEVVFMRRLEEEKDSIDKGLQYLGVPVSSRVVINNVGIFFDWSKSAQEGYKKASSIFGDAITDLFKLIIVGVMSDDLKPIVRKSLNFDPNKNYWSTERQIRPYEFPWDGAVAKYDELLSPRPSREYVPPPQYKPCISKERFPAFIDFHDENQMPASEPLTPFAI